MIVSQISALPVNKMGKGWFIRQTFLIKVLANLQENKVNEKILNSGAKGKISLFTILNAVADIFSNLLMEDHLLGIGDNSGFRLVVKVKYRCFCWFYTPEILPTAVVNPYNNYLPAGQMGGPGEGEASPQFETRSLYSSASVKVYTCISIQTCRNA